jgi:hypothetical protein
MTKGEKQVIIGLTVTISFALLATYLSYIIVKRIVFKERYKLVREAKQDIDFWQDKTELNPKVSDRLIDYWKTVGTKFTKSQMQSGSTHSTYPWSAAYVSDLIKRAGYKNFKPSATHVGYVIAAKNNRKNKLKNSFWAYAPSEQKEVEIGDILVKGRSGSKPTLENVTPGMPSHGDVVIDIIKENGKKYAIAVGGNVGDKVKTTKINLTSKERLMNSNIFAHLKYV